MMDVTMKNFARFFLLAVSVMNCSASVFAQGFRLESKSPPAATGSETFISLEGRFSIALPKQLSGYNPHSVNTPNGPVENFSYDWRTANPIWTTTIASNGVPCAALSDGASTSPVLPGIICHWQIRTPK